MLLKRSDVRRLFREEAPLPMFGWGVFYGFAAVLSTSARSLASVSGETVKRPS